MLVQLDGSGVSPPLWGERRRSPDDAGKKRSTSGKKKIKPSDSGSCLSSQRPQFLTPKDESELIGLYQRDGDLAARDRLILAFQPLVRRIARKYTLCSSAAVEDLNLEDLVSEGQPGLIRALDKFDPSLGYRFSTYARWWVKEAIIKYVRAVGGHIAAGAMKLELDQPITSKDGEEITLGEKIPTETYDDLTFQAGNLAHAREKLDAIIADKLDPREAQIIADRYLREKSLTLDEVGASLGVSHQRAGQLEARAIGKLSREAALNKPIGKHSRNAMVRFYADTISQHNDVEGYVDAARLRFPDATQADRIAAHRMADVLRLRVDPAPPKHIYSEPKPSPQMAHHRRHASGLAKSRGNKPLKSWRGPYGGPVIHGWR